MGKHAKPFNAVADRLLAWLTLALAYLQVVRNVSTGRHAWKPLPEVDTGATEEFAAVLHDWNRDPITVRFGPVWPSVDPDRASETARSAPVVTP